MLRSRELREGNRVVPIRRVLRIAVEFAQLSRRTLTMLVAPAPRPVDYDRRHVRLQVILRRRWVLDYRRAVNLCKKLRPHRCLPEGEPQPILCLLRSRRLNKRRAEEEIRIAIEHGIAKRYRTTERNIHHQRLADQLTAARHEVIDEGWNQRMPEDDRVGEVRVPWGTSDCEDRTFSSLDGAQASLFIRSDDHALDQQVIGIEDRLEPDRFKPRRKAKYVEHGEHESADLRLPQGLAIIRRIHVGSFLRKAA